MRFIITPILYLILINHAFAQKHNPDFIALRTRIGGILIHDHTIAHLPQKPNLAFELEFKKKNNNLEISNGYINTEPGISIGFNDFGNRKILGYAFSISQHNSISILSYPKFGNLEFRFGCGAAIITKKYNPSYNQENMAIGNNINGMLDFQLAYKKEIKRFQFGVGFSFTHFSNGDFSIPNEGLNLLFLDLNLGYTFNNNVYKHKPKRKEDILEDPLKVRFSVIASKHEVPIEACECTTLPIIASQTFISKRLNQSAWKFDAGLEITKYIGYTNVRTNHAMKLFESLQLGFFFGPSIQMKRSEVFVNLGYLYHKHEDPKSNIYNKLGYRYFFTDTIFGLFGIRANFGDADYVEFGIGVNLN